jgi:O-antigen ligase
MPLVENPPPWVRWLPIGCIPGTITIYLGFSGGGFFAGVVGVAAAFVALALILRVAVSEQPFEGVSVPGMVAVAALAAFAVWVLLSQAWSDAPARALVEFDRALLYVLVLALFVTFARTEARLAVALGGFAFAATALCYAGLASRVLPDVVHAPPDIESERLSWPLTYWNAMGVLSALAVIACLYFATAERLPWWARVSGAAAIPGIAVTLYFTFSRGPIALAIAAVVVFVLIARPRGAPGAVLAVVGPTAVALVVAYGADRLAEENPTRAAAHGQAHRVALVTALAILAAGLLRALFLRLDTRLARVELSRRRTRALNIGLAVTVLVTALAVTVAFDLPSVVSRQYDRFVEGRSISSKGDLRNRLTDPGNNGRLDGWRVARDGFRDAQLKGHGAATYEIQWARNRPTSFTVIDAHSLYLETLAELGLVGMALLAIALVSILVAVVRCVRGPSRSHYAALALLVCVWLVHAGIDWDWEMPVVTLWVFALGGLALARRADPEAESRGWVPGRLARLLIGLGVLLLAVTPGLMFVSQHALDRSVHAFKRGDCADSVDAALASNRVLSVRPEPLELLAYCDVRLGRADLGLAAMRSALERDPDSWQLEYGLALVRAADGKNPRAAARRAHRLNPRSSLTQDAVEAFHTNDPQKWRRRALRARLPLE